MSFLGVGAPEAILVAIVSLIVFGPKGLAEAAKSIGSSLRAFKPTIKEVVEVSQDLRSTLETELGLDELRDATRPVPRTPSPLLNDPSTLPEVAAQAAAAAAKTDAASGGAGAAAGAAPASAEASGLPSLKAVSESTAQALDPDIAAKRAASAALAWGPSAPEAAAGKPLSQLSLEELEAELARRKKSPAA